MNITHKELKSGDENRIGAIFPKRCGTETDIIIDGERCRVAKSPDTLVEQLKKSGAELLAAKIISRKFGSRVEPDEEIILNLTQISAYGPRTYPAESSQETRVTTGFVWGGDGAFTIDAPFRNFCQKMDFPISAI